MKKVFLFICVVIISATCSCGGGKKEYMEDDIRLWKDTPIWNFAKSLDEGDTVLAAKMFKIENFDIDVREPKFNQTLLIWAVQNGYSDVVRFLLLHGANPNACDSRGETSLMLDCFLNKDTTITRLLLDFGADPNSCIVESEKSMPKSPLYNAASNSLEKVQMLIKAGAEVDKSLGAGETALLNAVTWNRFDVIWYLLAQCNANSQKAYAVVLSGDTVKFIDMIGLNPYDHTPENEEYIKNIKDYIKKHEP